MRIMITAGPTCEDLDAVRYLTNRSSGRAGYALAAESARRGHESILLSGPVSLEPPANTEVINIRSARDLHRECLAGFDDIDVFIAAAAVADFTPAEPFQGKIKKSDTDLLLRLVPTPDILAELGRRKTTQILIGFAVEAHGQQTRALPEGEGAKRNLPQLHTGLSSGRQNAEKKLGHKRLDAIVLNTPESFGQDLAEFALFTAGGGWVDLGRLSKRDLAVRVLDLAEQLAAR